MNLLPKIVQNEENCIIFYLQSSIVEFLAHLHDLDDGFLGAQNTQLHNGLVVFLLRSLGAKLQTTD